MNGQISLRSLCLAVAVGKASNIDTRAEVANFYIAYGKFEILVRMQARKSYWE